MSKNINVMTLPRCSSRYGRFVDKCPVMICKDKDDRQVSFEECVKCKEK